MQKFIACMSFDDERLGKVRKNQILELNDAQQYVGAGLLRPSINESNPCIAAGIRSSASPVAPVLQKQTVIMSSNGEIRRRLVGALLWLIRPIK